jgi:transposase/transposase IS116/IS110/IS902 family protein
VTSEFDFYVGIDWATQKHQACIMDAEGQVLEQRKFEHSGEGILEFLGWMEVLAQGRVHRIAVAIEVPRGPLVEAFLEHQWTVFSINPKQLDRFRDRHSVAGAKDDSRDAFVLGDSLRTDQHCFRRLTTDHPDIMRIRELSRTEETLTVDLRRWINQLYQLLLRYYPPMLQLCPMPDELWLWALLELAPTPQLGAKLKPARIRRLLAQHHIRRWSAEEIAAILAAPALPLAPGSVEAASEHVLLLIPQLRLLATIRKQVAARMEELLDEMASSSDTAETNLFRDVSLLRSLPGIGRVVAGTFLAEAAGPLEQRDYHAIRAHGGIAPVTRQSGKSKHVGMRYRCNSRLRNALYHWARTSVQHDFRSNQQYARLRAAGHSHGRALRGVADRLLTVLIAMLKTGQPYDAKRRLAPSP